MMNSKRPPFVGRITELNRFRELLEPGDGPAGQGKSWLLEACLEECKKKRLKHSGIFDFFNDNLRTRVGVITELAKRFDVDGDSGFQQAIQEYYQEIEKGHYSDRAVSERARDKAEEALIEVLKPKRSAKPRVILADTVELISNSDLGNWFFCTFLPRLSSHFRVLAAGREIPGKCDQQLENQPIRVNLAGLQLEDVSSYFHEKGLPLDNEDLMRVHSLTGGGQPLLVALVLEALKQGTLHGGVDLHELRKLSAGDILERLVDNPLMLDTPEDSVLLYMAHIYHGIDVEMLSTLFTPEQLETSNYEKFLRNLTRFPFIKFSVVSGVYRLHDFFRERSREQIWLYLDPFFTVREKISRELLPVFDSRLQGFESGIPSGSQNLDTLKVQRLYHLIFANREQAYGELWELLDNSWHAYKFDYMDRLLASARDINSTLRSSSIPDIILDRIEKYFRALLFLENWNTRKALELAEEVISDSAGVQQLYLASLVVKGTALGRLGKIDEGLYDLREAYHGYNALLEVTEKAEAGDAEAKKALSSEHGAAAVRGIRPERFLILNTIGYLERQRARFEDAEMAFRASYELSSVEMDGRWRASAATQLGTIYRYLGDMAMAYDYIEIGLALREKLGQKGQIAYSLRALGKLQRDNEQFAEARKSFYRALKIWVELNAEGDLASVYQDLGWIDNLERMYDNALELYEKAEVIYRRFNIQSEMPSLRHKQGLTWIAKAIDEENEMVKAAALERAEEYLQDGIHIGRRFHKALIVANSLVNLCVIAAIRGEHAHLEEMEKEVRVYEVRGYRFGPTYAELEKVLGDVASQQSQKQEFNLEHFDRATDHYCRMFLYLVRHDPNRYRRQQRKFLHNWLPSLREDLRQRAVQRFIECWQSQPDNLSTKYPGFIRALKFFAEF